MADDTLTKIMRGFELGHKAELEDIKLKQVSMEEQLKNIDDIFARKQLRFEKRAQMLSQKAANAEMAAKWLRAGVIAGGALGAATIGATAATRQGRDLARRIAAIPIGASPTQ